MILSALMKFSWKNLWAHRLRMFLTVGGVSIGVAAIVFLVSLGFGLEQLVTSQVANFEAFTIIDVPSANPPSGKINQESIDRMSQIPHITYIERVVDLAGRVRLSDQDSTTETVVIGSTPRFFDLSDISIDRGKVYENDATNQTVVSLGLANLIGYKDKADDLIGKELSLNLILPKTLRKSDDVDGPRTVEDLPLKVVGITPEESGPIMYIAHKLADEQGIINSTTMKVQVDDKEAVPTVRKQMENSGFATEYIGDTVDQITQVFSIFRLVLGSFGVIALIVAALGTFNTLTISLIERIREVALLKMLGMKRGDVFKLFINESITIGALGGIIGALSGMGIGYAANKFVETLAVRSGSDPVVIFYTPVIFLVIIAAGSFIVGFLTGLYPALRAIKTNPLDALRYE